MKTSAIKRDDVPHSIDDLGLSPFIENPKIYIYIYPLVNSYIAEENHHL